MIDKTEVELYSRLLSLPYWNESVLERLKNSFIVIDTCLEHTIRYTAASGIGRIALVGAKQSYYKTEISGLNPYTKVYAESEISNKDSRSWDMFICLKDNQKKRLNPKWDSSCILIVDPSTKTLETTLNNHKHTICIDPSDEIILNADITMCTASILSVTYLAFGSFSPPP